jgi:polyhydroxyalkanoate synthesis repressor PhaR
METVMETSGAGEKPRRVIKRYSNRKLYDTKDSRYVTLQQIGEMVRAGEEVQIIDNATKEDKTEVTLALIISEDLKSQPRSVPLGTLRELIQERGERLLSQLREGPIGRLIPGAVAGEGVPPVPPIDGAAAPPAVAPAVPAADAAPAIPPSPPSTEGDKPAGAKARLTEIVESIDERIGAILPGVGLFRELKDEVKRLTQRVEELEARVHGTVNHDPTSVAAAPGHDGGSAPKPPGDAKSSESIKKE